MASNNIESDSDVSSMDEFDFTSLLQPPTEIYKSAYEEAVAYNVYGQYLKLNTTIKDPEFINKYKYKEQLFKRGHKKMLEYIIRCVKNDMDFGDFYSEENEALMREAGQLLWDAGGEKAMRDGFIWIFIPQRYHREIDTFWSGIGTWQA